MKANLFDIGRCRDTFLASPPQNPLRPLPKLNGILSISESTALHVEKSLRYGQQLPWELRSARPSQCVMQFL